MRGARGALRIAPRCWLVCLVAVVPSAQPSEIWFEEVSAASGLEFEHVRAVEERFWLPEIMSGGACWLDYDGDGDLDLYLVQGGVLEPDELRRARQHGPQNELYRNDVAHGFRRVSEAAGVADPGYGIGCAVGDVDGDGREDLYVTNIGPNVLFLNRADGRFEAAGSSEEIADPSWSASATFADVDLDGDLDLFVVNYIDWRPAGELDCFSGGLRDYCHPDRYDAPAPDRLFLNQGDGTFSDGSRQAGLGRAFGNGLGVVAADLDGDRLPEIYVANDGMPNQLWVNRGGGRFAESALLSGVAVNRSGKAEAGMGVQAFDVDDDLDLDLFTAHLRGESNTLYLNLGDGFFEDATARSGLAAPSLGRTGFGLGFFDFDLDGQVDLYVANGRVGRSMESHVEDRPFAEPDSLYRGVSAGRFAEVTGRWVDDPAAVEASRGAAMGDFDGDGRVDVAVVGSGGRLRLLRNRAGREGRWIQVLPLGRSGGVAVGTVVEAEWQGKARLRLVQPGFGYCGSNDPRVHLGVGDAPALDRLTVTRPSGQRTVYSRLPTNRLLVLPASMR